MPDTTTCHPVRDDSVNEGAVPADSVPGGSFMPEDRWPYEQVTPSTMRYAIAQALRNASVDGYELVSRLQPSGRITVSLYDPEATDLLSPLGEATLYVHTGGTR